MNIEAINASFMDFLKGGNYIQKEEDLDEEENIFVRSPF
jgi:hypothetical protein